VNEVSVLIVEDEPLIAENIAHYLNNEDFSVCGIAYDDEEALMFLENSHPDIAILDINLGAETTGIDLAGLINRKYQLPFVFLTSYADRETIESAKKVLPWGYIVKPFNGKTLKATMEIALFNFAEQHNRSVPALRLSDLNSRLLSAISEREFEVLEMIYKGKTNQQIAETLFISINTVKRHINNAYLKIDARSRSTAIARLRELSAV